MGNTQGMKYHKFLIYFGLFFIAVLNSISAALYFSGVMYSWSDPTIDVTVVYSIYGTALKVLDIVCACLLGAATIIAFVARYRLVKGFKDGVHTHCGLLIFEAVLPFIYSIWGHFILEEASIINLKDVFFAIAYIAVAMLTLNYYKKREELFKN
jgi:hypothetical protein